MDSQKNLPAKARSKILLCFYDTYIYSYIKYICFCSGSSTPMSIIFEHKADVLLWKFGKLIHNVHNKQYLFTAQCVWWISAIVGLQPALVSYLDNQRIPCSVLLRNNKNNLDSEDRSISAVPRDIQRNTLFQII